jgi:cellobiose transport system permease protein
VNEQRTRRPPRLSTLAAHIFFVALSLLVLFPFFWMVVASTRTTSDLLSYPPHVLPGTEFLPNLQQLTETLPLIRAFFNSLFIAVVTTVLVLFFCSLAGFGFAKYRFPGRERLFFVLLATLALPGAVSLVPWYQMMVAFDWVNDYRALIIPNIANAFGIFFMRQFISHAIPDEMLEAARVDGCGPFRFYLMFVLPLTRPALGTLGLFMFVNSWNDFLQPLIILNDPQRFTLPIILELLQNQYGKDLVLLMVAATVATVPILVMFIVMSKQFIAGLTAGAVKG